MQLFDLEAIRRFLVEVAQHYAESAPDVSDWAGELYERCADALAHHPPKRCGGNASLHHSM